MQEIINTNMNDYMKKVEEVALYVRVSTDEQAINGDSLRTQKEELANYALNNGYHIYGIYEDDGFSATNLNRPALQQMLKDVRNRKINRILITKLDRLSRGVRNYYKILDTLDEYEVYWSTVFEKYDSSTANGRLHINIMLSVAENESAQTGERIQSVFKTKLYNNEIISGKIPVGYKKENKKLVIDQEKKQFIIETFNYYLKCGSIYKTFNYLTANYCDMNYSRTMRLLNNKIYIGTKKTKYGDIENYCEAIVEKSIFEKVQTLLRKNERKRTNYENTFLFSGIIRCAKCSHKISGKFHKNMQPTSTYYYLCNHARFKKKCTMLKYINEYKLEQKLLQEIKPILEEYLAYYNCSNINIQQKDNSKEKTLINRKLEKLRDLYVKDMIQIEHYESEYTNLINQLNILSEKKIEKKKDIDFKELELFLKSDFILIYNNLPRDKKRRIWANILESIYVDSNYNLKLVFI